MGRVVWMANGGLELFGTNALFRSEITGTIRCFELSVRSLKKGSHAVCYQFFEISINRCNNTSGSHFKALHNKIKLGSCQYLF